MMKILLAVVFLAAAAAVGAAAAMLKWSVYRRRERSRLHAQVSQAIERITADGKVEGPKGKFRWRNWARKWVNHANSLPAPRPQSQRFPQFKELPPLPRKDE